MSPSFVVQGRLRRGAAPVEIVIAGGRIETVHPAAAGRNGPAAGGPDCLVTEGFLDIQVNGFAGVDFNRPALTADDLREIDAATKKIPNDGAHRSRRCPPDESDRSRARRAGHPSWR